MLPYQRSVCLADFGLNHPIPMGHKVDACAVSRGQTLLHA